MKSISQETEETPPTQATKSTSNKPAIQKRFGKEWLAKRKKEIESRKKEEQEKQQKANDKIKQKEESKDINPEIMTMIKEYKKRIEEFEEISDFPTSNNHIIKNSDYIKYELTYKHMKLTYPICHGYVLKLFLEFLKFKLIYGSKIERTLYKNQNIVTLMNRLMTLRAIFFLNPSDSYMLRNGVSGRGNWEKVGTKKECQLNPNRMTLEKYMSYDEMLLSALCGISSYTQFINNGSRNNCGRVNKHQKHEPIGVYMGLVGARFEKSDVMEHSLMSIDLSQNLETKGYGFKNKLKYKHNNQRIRLNSDASSETNNNSNNNNNDTKVNGAEIPDDDDILADVNVDDIYADDDIINNTKNADENGSSKDSQIKQTNIEKESQTPNKDKNKEQKVVKQIEKEIKVDDKNELEPLSYQDIVKIRKVKFFEMMSVWYGISNDINDIKAFLPSFADVDNLFLKVKNIKKGKLNKLSRYLNTRYIKSNGPWGDTYLDVFMFKSRLRISLELFLFDSDYRASVFKNDNNNNNNHQIKSECKDNEISSSNSHNTNSQTTNDEKENENSNNNSNDKESNKQSYCHMVGLGLGVWTLSGFKRIQNRLFVEVVKDIINDTYLPNISCIDFSYFDNQSMYTNENCDKLMFEKGECFDASKKHKIDIKFSQRNPSDLLEDKYKNNLLCGMYAWDSNALPGNEYYQGMLAASGDPAAASCSTIPFTQNSEINKEYVNGKSTIIYFRDGKKYKRMNLSNIYDNIDENKWLKWSNNSQPYPNMLQHIDITKYLDKPKQPKL